MSKSPLVLRIAVPSPLWQAFDYLSSNQKVEVGMRVCVPFGRRELVGVVLEVDVKPECPLDRLKSVIELIDDTPLLSPEDLKLYQWASDYYHHPIGEVVVGSLPALLRRGKEVLAPSLASGNGYVQHDMTLNTDQQEAVTAITQADSFSTFLLAGVTGSGKTEVYLRAIDYVLQRSKQALVLVPEIALTPQTVSRFEERFSVPVVLMHSNLTDKQRAVAWLQAKRGEARIVIGTRSAVFVPFKELGIIVLDEEHDASFKQQSGFRYSARDVAVMRGYLSSVPVVLGSATPSLESLHNAKRGRYQLLKLPARAGKAKPPAIHLIDLRKKKLMSGLSLPLIEAMKSHLSRDGQVMLFLNRRGYAPTVMCHSCGWVEVCGRCDARLVLHQRPARLHCHHCGSSKAMPPDCPQCKQSELMPIGLGTEQLEEALEGYFPGYTVLRMDRDSTRKKDALTEKLKLIHDRKAQILIGTQMLAKGHHFPHLTLTAIVDADGGLYSADFRAMERMAQLLMQVAGRSGREEQAGEVYLQTHHPENELLQLLLKEGYLAFTEALSSDRELAQLPPFSHWVVLRAEALKSGLPMQFLQQAKGILNEYLRQGVSVLGPVPALMERKAGRYRSQLLLQTETRGALHAVLKPMTDALSQLKTARQVRWSLDVDPQEVL